MRSSKSKTIESRGTSRTPIKISKQSKPIHSKNSCQKSNSPKNLIKNKSSKQLFPNPSTLKSTIKHYTSNVQLRTPTVKSLKPSQSHNYLKKLDKGKEIMMQKPTFVKKKNQNIGHLQTKLRNLQDKISTLKSNISSTDKHIQRMKKSRTKSKESKNSSVSISHKKRTSESIDKSPIKQSSQSKQQNKSMIKSPSKNLNTYVTKWKPSEISSSSISHTKLPSQEVKPSIIGKYYIKHKSAVMKQHLLQSITIFNYMKKIIKPQNHQIQNIKVSIPGKALNKKTLVFDLDETLIHCVEMQQESDIKLPISFPNGGVVQAGINIRAYAKQILSNLSKKFEIIVFTASHSCYANVILDHLDPKKQLIHHRYYRDNCYKTPQGMYIKDLRIFSNRDLQNIVLIDNAPYSYFFQLQNGIPIIPFYNSKQDIELKCLQNFLLKQVYPASNVKTVLKNHFKLHKYKDYSEPQKIIQQLYGN